MALLFLPCLLTPYKSWTPSGPRDPLKYHPLCTKTTHEKATFSVLYFAQLSMSFPSMTFNSFRHPKFLEIESLSKSLLLLSPKLRRLGPWSISSPYFFARRAGLNISMSGRKKKSPAKPGNRVMHGFQARNVSTKFKPIRLQALLRSYFAWFTVRLIFWARNLAGVAFWHGIWSTRLIVPSSLGGTTVCNPGY